jgi:hypothetical protein
VAQSYTALARGPEAVFWNPANLALRGSPRFQWNLLSVPFIPSLVVENNSWSVKTYNDNFTSSNKAVSPYTGAKYYLDDAAKSKVLGDIPSSGLRFNLDLEPMLALGIPINGGVAFPMPWGLNSAVALGFSAGVEGEMPKDMVELILKGNEFDRQYDIAKWDGSGWVVGSLNWAAAKPWMPARFKPYLDEFAVGGTLKLVSGGYAEVKRSNGGFLVRPQGANLDAYLVTQTGGGMGYGLDLGVAGVTRDRKITFSAGLLNFLDVMSWGSKLGIEARQDSVFAKASDLRVTRALDPDTKSIQDVLENDDVDGDGDIDYNQKISEQSFSRSLPAMLRIGGTYQLQPKLLILGNWDQAFSSGFGSKTTPRISAGLEYRLVDWFPARFGMSLGGRGASTSIGTAFGPFTMSRVQLRLLDWAWVFRGGLLPGYSKGMAVAVQLFQLNLQ